MSFSCSFLLFIRCYSGGETNPHWRAFLKAMGNAVASLGEGVFNVEMRSLKDLRESDMTLEQFMTWLLEGDIHFILCYPHEGLEHFGWSICNMLDPLRNHQGFPMKDQVCTTRLTSHLSKFYLDARSGRMSHFNPG